MLILPKHHYPKGPFNRSAFFQPKTQITFENEDSGTNLTKNQIKKWNSEISISPDDFFHILTKDLPGHPSLTISIYEDDTYNFGVSLREKEEKYRDKVGGAKAQRGERERV